MTLKEIADKVGVSIPLVSKVLNDKEVSVSQEKREKIMAYYNDYNKKKKNTSSFLAVKRTENVIALIQPNMEFDFFIQMTAKIEKKAKENGFSVLLLNSHENIQTERELLYFCNSKFVSGIIINASDNTANRDVYQTLQESEIPMVFIDRNVSDFECSSVTTDNFTGSYIITKNMLERGHKNILFIFHGKSIFTTVQFDRFAGYQKAIQEYGQNSLKEYLYWDKPIEQQPIFSDAHVLQDFDAVVLSTSWEMIPFLELLKKINFKKKIDISAFDSFHFRFPQGNAMELMAKYVNILTIIEQQCEDMADHAVDILVSQIISRSFNKESIVLQPSKPMDIEISRVLISPSIRI